MLRCLAILIGLITSGTLAFGAGYDASNFSADGRKWQPVPSGYVAGKDSGPGQGMHNAGEECGACHRPNGKAPVVFTASGTLYKDRAARKPLEGGEVILQDINGNVISMISNGVGNFWTFAPISSNPWAVASHGGMTDLLYSFDEQGFHPADPNDARSWQYKAWVKFGNQIRPMVTIAPVGGSTDPTSRMSCNMHHGNMGTRGALWGSKKSTLSSFARSRLSFREDILPIFRNKCVPCHVSGDTGTRLATRSDVEGNPPTSIDHSSSLDLISYGGSSVVVNNVTWTKRGIQDVTVGYQRNPEDSPCSARPPAEKGATPFTAEVHSGRPRMPISGRSKSGSPRGPGTTDLPGLTQALKGETMYNMRRGLPWILVWAAAFLMGLSPQAQSQDTQLSKYRVDPPGVRGVNQAQLYPPMPAPGKKIPIGDDYYFVYGFSKTPKMGTVILKVELYSRDGKRATSLEIFADAGMPSMRGAHDTGPRPLRLSKAGDYLLPIDIMMPGKWDIRFTFLDKGAKIIFQGSHHFEV